MERFVNVTLLPIKFKMAFRLNIHFVSHHCNKTFLSIIVCFLVVVAENPGFCTEMFYWETYNVAILVILSRSHRLQ